MNQRKQNAISVKIAKDNLVKVMEDARANGNKATKMIKMFMAPGALTGGATPAGGGGEAGAKKPKKKLTLGARTAPEADLGGGGGSSSPLGPKPANDSLEERFNPGGGPAAPGPYVSPYDLPADPGASTTITF